MAHAIGICIVFASVFVIGFIIRWSCCDPPLPLCSECKWIKLPTDERACEETYCECNHPSNVDMHRTEDWFANKTTSTFKRKPRDLNRINNCKNYNPKVSTQFGM